MEFVDPEDGPPPFREPPAPDDRLWRHPSEVGLPPAAREPRERRRSRLFGRARVVWVVAGTSALAASLLSSALVLALVGVSDRRSSGPVSLERQLVKPRPASTLVSSPIADVAEGVRPAVVHLDVEAGDGSSTGSAVMFRTDGHLLTNAHVVAGATSITVVTSGGRRLAARMVGGDPETDVAVVQVDGGPYPVATLGSSGDLRVGQTAIAVGSPLGPAGGPSVTVGVISALHGQVTIATGHRTLVDTIQTDAPVSPGSTGGALLDVNGGVVGILTAVGPSAGTGGYAIPIDAARSVADQLIRTGRVTHVWLGVEGSDLDGATAAELAVAGGAMVGQVESGSPAARGGLVAGDAVVAVNGRRVRSMSDLMVAVRSSSPGQTLTLEVVRDHRHRFMPVTLLERPAEG